MAANTSPIFILAPNVGYARLTAANTASDGSGVVATLFTAQTNGSRIERVKYHNSQVAPAASSAMVIRLFVSDTTGANYRLYDEFAMAAATRAAGVIGANGTYVFSGGLVLKSGQLLGVIQSVYAGVQDQMDYVAEGGDY